MLVLILFLQLLSSCRCNLVHSVPTPTANNEVQVEDSTIYRILPEVPSFTKNIVQGSTNDGPVVEPVSHFGEQPSLSHKDNNEGHQKGRMTVASFRPSYVATPLIIGTWVIIAGLTKIGFNVTPKLSLICPESCLLIVVGVIIGLLLFYAGLSNVGPLTPNVFFLYMLPPIVLDAGYFMPNRPFFDNLVTILMFAVLGTVLNAMSVGMSLWAVGLTNLYGVPMPLLDTLLFSSIACAVDPIAVLAVFEEIHVNEVLYIIVFGESLLNDAVTVVLYHMFEGYAEMGPENIITVDYLAGVASFFVVAVGGTVVGILWGLLAAFVSRFTHHVRVIEPLFVFVMSYLSYVSAELFHFSGILSLTFCGITMKNYVEENISYKSHVTVKYAMKMLASSSETIIFLFLGVSTVNDNHEWNTWFVVMTIFFCTVYRTIWVIFLTAIANRFRLHRINKVEQFIMAYGGLRGAVAFALALIVSEQIIPTKKMMVTTIIALVFFTVFIQGMTIGPLVRILNVPTSSKMKLSMNERILTRSMDHLMAAIEDIVGQKMGNYHLRDKFKYYNNKYIRPLLTRDHANAEPKIFETYSKLNLADAMNLVKRNSANTLAPQDTGRSGASLSSLFRSYTMANLETADTNSEGEHQKFEKSGLPRNNSSFLNVDIGELEYSQSNKDLADAELHHILADAMSKPARRSRLSRGQLFDHGGRQSRAQGRYFPHRRRSSYGYRSFKHNNSQQNPNDNCLLRASDRSYKGKNNLMPPPPEISFTNADDSPGDWNAAKTIPYLKQEDPNSTNSSVIDLSSSCGANDDEFIYFAPPKFEDNTQRRDSVTSNKNQETERQDSLQIDNASNKTLTETTLPWKRTESSSSEEEPETARKQHEFPSWIRSKEYFPRDSPTDTLLYRIRRSSIPSVREIFPENEDATNKRERRNSDTQSPVHNPHSHPKPSKQNSRDSCSRVDMEAVAAALRRQNSKAKDVVIDFVPNGKVVTVRDSSLDEGDNRCEATRL